MQQSTGIGIAQDMPQALRRLRGVQGQVHRSAAEHGEQAGVERRRLAQADANHTSVLRVRNGRQSAQ
ncbi:hypothetical protein D3C77_269510 [compost metagenome]